MRQNFIKNLSDPEQLDLLPTNPVNTPFQKRVRSLNLSAKLERKVQMMGALKGDNSNTFPSLTPLSVDEEKELASTVLYYRQIFSEQVVNVATFRQAALTVIQNIYLFRNRKIFFGSDPTACESDRQDALQFLTSGNIPKPLPVCKTFQHLIIGRIWNRIVNRQQGALKTELEFVTLHDTVVKMNTLRNIYMILSRRLVKKLAGRINDFYKISTSYEDAVQIGSIGVARAAYRYHQSCGVRFSTYASHWIFKEIQRQSLSGRLINVSADNLYKRSKASKTGDSKTETLLNSRINNATVLLDNESPDKAIHCQDNDTVPRALELKQLGEIVLKAINNLLSPKNADIIRRRYGLPPYAGDEQSIIEISKNYGVSRSSIYQIEKHALNRLQKHLKSVL